MHRLNSGHFAVEDNLDYIAKNMKRFCRPDPFFDAVAPR
jgi:hypothetical protein